MVLKTAFLIVVVLLIVLAGAMAYGSFRWKTGTQKLHTKLEAARLPISPAIYDEREIESLPPPVRRYFRAVLQPGQPLVSVARFTHAGQFNTGENQAQWSRFTSSQVTVTQRPGFDWDARIALAPGLHVFVHDAYRAGEGILHGALLGLVTVADLKGTAEVAQGELMRFLAEAAWYPTALLPSQGVQWEAVDDQSAQATLTDGATTVRLIFRFNQEGLLIGMETPARSRMVKGKVVPTPWQGRVWGYETRGGMRIPLEGEVAWELPEGSWPYWRGRLTEITYDFA